MPNLFEGALGVSEEVLDWIIEMKVEHHIENVNRRMLEDLVLNTQYIAAYFGKAHLKKTLSIFNSTRPPGPAG